MQFLLVFMIFTIAMMGFILSIKFSRYKQRSEQSSCCGGGHCGCNVEVHDTEKKPVQVQGRYIQVIGEHVHYKET